MSVLLPELPGIVVLHGVGSNNNHCALYSQSSFFVALP